MTTLTGANGRTAWIERAIGWFNLAATPSFALMAWVAVADVPRTGICASDSAIPSIAGMAWMYLLMSFFHTSPWVRLIFDHPAQHN